MQQARMPDPASMTSGPGRTSGGRAARPSSDGEALDLAAWLQSPHRDLPAVVITAARAEVCPVEAEALASEFSDRVEVYAVTRGPAVAVFNEALPESWRVFGDAVRVYPAGGAAPQPHLAGSSATAAALRRRLSSVLRPSSDLRSESAERWPPTEEPHRVHSVAEARELAAHLMDVGRRRPFLIVSIHPNASQPYLDADDLALEVKGLVPVVVVDADATFGLTDALGDRALSVFYGAGRVYPIGDAWRSDPFAAPLVMCTGPGQAVRSAERLVGHALTAAHRAGLLEAPIDITEQRASQRAKVSGFSSDHHVLVRTESGQQAILQVARLRIDVPPDRLLRRGQRLAGTLTGHGLLPEFIPDPPQLDVAQMVRRECPDGTTIPARVCEVEPGSAEVALHPDFRARLTAQDDDLTALMSPGDVVAVEVAWVEGQCLVALADDRRAFDALPVLPGGPPWLLLDEPGAVPAATPSNADRVSQAPRDPAMAAELADAQAAASLYAERAEELESSLEQLRKEAKGMRAELRKARNERAQRSLPEVFAEPQAQFRWEVATTYLLQVAESDRAQYPLGDYDLGRVFLSRLDAMHGVSRHKVLDVVVDVLCDRAKENQARELHPWLAARSGKQEERADGARAWRVSLQVHSPSARRLKYWRLPDGRIELDSVGVHDDGLR